VALCEPTERSSVVEEVILVFSVICSLFNDALSVTQAIQRQIER
jgi:hypothetical protein